METLTQEAPTVLATDVHPADPAVTALIEERDRLRAENAQVRQHFEEYRTKVASDCEILSKKLIDEANDRGWCEQYDQIVESLNSRFSVLAIEERITDHEIEVIVTGTVSVRRYVTVSAANFDAAVDAFNSDPDTYLDSDEALQEEISNSGFDDISIDVA
jgi:hypothetical protein